MLSEAPGEVLVRVHIERGLMAVAVWLDGGELTARGLRRDLTREQGEALKSLHLVACGIPATTGDDDERVTDALERLLPALDLADVLPEGRSAHVVVLPSRLAALVPWAAAGAPGATLLDRADAIAYLPNLAPRVHRQQVVAPRSGTLLVAPGEHCDEQPTRFHDVAFADRAEGEEALFGERASCEAVLRAAGRSDVVSVYSHGLHRAGEGAEIALAGESLSLETLGGEWAGCERVELWACQSGVNVPTAPLIPSVDEAFGIDVEFHHAGVRSTVGTLWSVPAFVTAHIVRRYRKSLAAHGDPARALADAQRWWRDHVLAALPSLLARTPEAELPGAVTALLGVRVTRDDLTATLGPLRADALLPAAAQRHVVRMFSSPEAWAGFRFLGVAGRRPEVVSDDARALTADERATLDAPSWRRPLVRGTSTRSTASASTRSVNSRRRPPRRPPRRSRSPAPTPSGASGRCATTSCAGRRGCTKPSPRPTAPRRRRVSFASKPPGCGRRSPAASSTSRCCARSTPPTSSSWAARGRWWTPAGSTRRRRCSARGSCSSPGAGTCRVRPILQAGGACAMRSRRRPRRGRACARRPSHWSGSSRTAR
ncbi:MAG: CHAT domain-containing protein [Polyangiales bacterium]